VTRSGCHCAARQTTKPPLRVVSHEKSLQDLHIERKIVNKKSEISSPVMPTKYNLRRTKLLRQRSNIIRRSLQTIQTDISSRCSLPKQSAHPSKPFFHPYALQDNEPLIIAATPPTRGEAMQSHHSAGTSAALIMQGQHVNSPFPHTPSYPAHTLEIPYPPKAESGIATPSTNLAIHGSNRRC
jgi:hypothetical protein